MEKEARGADEGEGGQEELMRGKELMRWTKFGKRGKMS